MKLGFLHTRHPDPCQELGQAVAIKLVQKLANGVYMAGRHIHRHIPGGGIS